MKKSYISNKILILMGVIFFCGCNESREKTSRVDELPFYKDASYTPQWISEKEISSDFHRIPSFELVNQLGENISEEDLNNKVTVVDFFFTICPGICPKMTSNMKMVQDAFMEEKKVMLLSHTVMPDYDSVEVLKEYANIKGIEKKEWYLLTGERSVIYDLGRNQYFIEEDLGLEKDPDDFIHTENFVLIDQNRRIRGIYNGLNKSSVKQLIADMRTLLES